MRHGLCYRQMILINPVHVRYVIDKVLRLLVIYHHTQVRKCNYLGLRAADSRFHLDILPHEPSVSSDTKCNVILLFTCFYIFSKADRQDLLIRHINKYRWIRILFSWDPFIYTILIADPVFTS